MKVTGRLVYLGVTQSKRHEIRRQFTSVPQQVSHLTEISVCVCVCVCVDARAHLRACVRACVRECYLYIVASLILLH